jgi:glycosyltransferase involved in cell wall biosynthesis
MHIAVFNQYHNSPDCAATSRHYTFLAHLARRHRVSLITTNTWLHQRITNLYPWVPEGVELHAFEVPYENKMGKGKRLIAFSKFAARVIQQGMLIDKPDVIWGISTPLTAAWAASQVAGWRKVPWVFEVQDLWPSFPIQMGAVPGKWLQNRLYALEQHLYRKANHIISLSPDMTDYIHRIGTSERKVTTLLNGTDLSLVSGSLDPELINLRQQYGLGDRQVLLYAGSYGRANDIPLLIDTARRLAARQDICFVFTGEGYHAPLLREAARSLPSIVILPPQPRHLIFSWFKLAQISLVPFMGLPVLDTNSPAKFFDSLAAGTPVIVTNQGWTKSFLEDHGCGWYSPAGDSAALAACIEQALADPGALAAAGRRGRLRAIHEFDREQQAEIIEQILHKAAFERPLPSTQRLADKSK